MPATRVLTCSAKRVVVAEGSIAGKDVGVASVAGVFVSRACIVPVGNDGSDSVETAGVQATKMEKLTIQADRMIRLYGTMNTPSTYEI